MVRLNESWNDYYYYYYSQCIICAPSHLTGSIMIQRSYTYGRQREEPSDDIAGEMDDPEGERRSRNDARSGSRHVRIRGNWRAAAAAGDDFVRVTASSYWNWSLVYVKREKFTYRNAKVSVNDINQSLISPRRILHSYVSCTCIYIISIIPHGKYYFPSSFTSRLPRLFLSLSLRNSTSSFSPSASVSL